MSARAEAESLAEALGLSVAKKFRDPHPLHLAVVAEAGGGHRLELRVVDPGHPLAGGRGVWVDLLSLDTTSPAGRSTRSPLARAVGLGRSQRQRRAAAQGDSAPPRVLDATTGLGEDAWLLAAAGCRVTAVERQPIVHALLSDALRRAGLAQPEIAGRITLLPCRDAAGLLQQLAQAPGVDADKLAPQASTSTTSATRGAAGLADTSINRATDTDAEPGSATAGPFDVVLLDPMFPEHRRRKTAERKPLRLLRLLAGDDEDAASLWAPAMNVARRRVVVKRPRRAPPLPDAGAPDRPAPPPASQHEGRGFRFDVYPVAAR